MSKLIKYTLIFLVLLSVIVAGALFYAAKNANALIAKFKPQIEQVASNAAKAKVTLGNLDLSIFPNALIKVSELKIARGETEGLRFSNLILDVELFPLLSGDLNIVKLSIQDPLVTFIKDKSGVRIDGLAKTKSSPKKVDSQTQVSSSLNINLQELEIDNATINFQDKIAGKKYTANNLYITTAIGITQNLLNLSDSEISVKLLNALKVGIDSSHIKLDLANGDIQIEDVTSDISGDKLKLNGNFNTQSGLGSLDLNSKEINLDNLKPLFQNLAPVILNFGLSGKIMPNINLLLKEAGKPKISAQIATSNFGASLGPLQISDANGTFKLTSEKKVQAITTKDYQFKFAGNPAKLNLNANLIELKSLLIKSLLLEAFSGTTSAKSELSLGGGNNFNTDVKIENINIEQASLAFMPNNKAKITGQLESANLHIGGNLAGAPASLNGKGDLLLKNGALKGNNLAAAVLGVVKDLPFLAGKLLDAVPENLQGEINGEDTPIRKMTANYLIKDSRLDMSKLELISTVFTLHGRGTVGFDSSVDLSAEFIFTPEFSEALSLKVKEVKKLQNEKGEVVIPLTLSGKLPKVIIVPNLKKLLQSTAGKELQNKLNEKAGELLNKAFGF